MLFFFVAAGLWLVLLALVLGAITSTITVSATQTNTPVGTVAAGPFTQSAAAGIYQTTVLAATTSYQAVTVPTGANFVMVGWTCAGNLILAGGGSDTGINMGPGTNGSGGLAVFPVLSGTTTIQAKLSSGTGNVTFDWY